MRFVLVVLASLSLLGCAHGPEAQRAKCPDSEKVSQCTSGGMKCELDEHRDGPPLDDGAAQGEADLLQELDAILAHGDLLPLGHRATAVDDRTLLERTVVEHVG